MHYPFKLTHIGGENCVTGSSHLIELQENLNIMGDCGLSMGRDRVILLSEMPVKPKEIDYLFITHAHIDHIGRIPDLIDHGVFGEIICTEATKALLIPMLEDAMTFSDRSSKEVDTISKQIDELSWGFEYNQTFELKNKIKFKLRNAGHILGSCFITFEIPMKKGKAFSVIFSVIFSGDLGNINTPILPDPDKPESCDLLVLESTYGGRNHEDRKNRIERLGKVLKKALSDNGKVLIPAFALGRTQELIYELDRLFTEGKYIDEIDSGSESGMTVGRERAGIEPGLNNKKIPVFIDTPLGLKLTGIYSGLKQFWDKEATELMKRGDHPLGFDGLYAVEDYKHHKKLMGISGPAIIIAGSGMCTGGRILEHLENGLADPGNDVIFVGYQAEGTLGRDILKYSKKKDGYVNLNGKRIPIQAAVHSLSGYSAHADQDGLVAFVEAMAEKPGVIKLVHGEPDAQSDLRNVLVSKGYSVEL